MFIVKKVIVHIAKPIADICNKSFISGIFPDNMKVDKIIRLLPVSILPQFSKIFKKVFYNKLVSFLNNNNIIYKNQYGFRYNHSTSLALMELIEDISFNLDNSMKTAGIFIDLKKAFDTIDHIILIKKMSHYGVRGTGLDRKLPIT